MKNKIANTVLKTVKEAAADETARLIKNFVKFHMKDVDIEEVSKEIALMIVSKMNEQAKAGFDHQVSAANSFQNKLKQEFGIIDKDPVNNNTNDITKGKKIS